MVHGPYGDVLLAKRMPQPAFSLGPHPSGVAGSPGPLAGGGQRDEETGDVIQGALLQLVHAEGG